MDTEPEQLIDSVREKEEARKLLRHGRNQLVKNTSSCYYYLDRENKYRRLQGLLPRLKACYWPESNYFKTRKRVGTTPKKVGAGGARKGRFQGVIKGVKVHRELKDFVQLDAKNFKKIHNKFLHNYSARILNAIVNRMGWQPFLPEFDIFDENLGIGTSVDMICLDKEGNLILLEFKTGYSGYFEESDGFMKSALAKLPNTVLNQATLQVVSAGLILERCYQVAPERMRYYVMRVDQHSLDIIPIENEFARKVGPHIYRDLAQSAAELGKGTGTAISNMVRSAAAADPVGKIIT